MHAPFTRSTVARVLFNIVGGAILILYALLFIAGIAWLIASAV